jgi:hypothetical protein
MKTRLPLAIVSLVITVVLLLMLTRVVGAKTPHLSVIAARNPLVSSPLGSSLPHEFPTDGAGNSELLTRGPPAPSGSKPLLGQPNYQTRFESDPVSW